MKKSHSAALISVLLLLFTRFVLAQHFWRGELMPQEKVRTTWGTLVFDKKKFRQGKEADRAAMAFDVIRSRIYVGKTRDDVIKDLGSPDGYYFSGLIPAYLINDPPKKGDDVWQLVFLLDKGGHVVDVVVHKNCCDK